MEIETLEQVEALVSRRIPEGPSLEYKQDLPLMQKSGRVEALKDLSGIGNGGGGTLVYGIEEDEEQEGIPVAIRPLTDRGLVGVLEDVVRSSVRPPLLMTHRVLEHQEGFLLVIEILRSPLGPYMVEAYGQQRYFVRIGTRTAPMGEQQVRDAYLLAARGRERRAEVWREHDLPIRALSGESSSLTLSALPEEPLTEVLDPGLIPLNEFQYPVEMQALAELGSFDKVAAVENLRIWAQGIFGVATYGNRPPEAVLRIHRDGAMGLATRPSNRLPLYQIPRALNAQLVYFAWIWKKLGLRTPIELQVQVQNLNEAQVEVGLMPQQRMVRTPPGVHRPAIELVSEFLPWELLRASIRHTFVHDFGNRLVQAFGYDKATLPFVAGWLYGPDGNGLGLSIAGGGVWDGVGDQKGLLYDSGRITNYYRNEMTVGYFVDGVVIDEEGRAMAALELASGIGLPDDFLLMQPTDDPRYRAANPGSPIPEDEKVTVPDPIGEWSDLSLLELLQP
jgi:hypothetical protein